MEKYSNMTFSEFMNIDNEDEINRVAGLLISKIDFSNLYKAVGSFSIKIAESYERMKPLFDEISKTILEFINYINNLTSEFVDSHESIKYSFIDSLNINNHDSYLFLNNLATGPPEDKSEENLINMPSDLSIAVFFSYLFTFLLINREMIDTFVNALNLDNTISLLVITSLVSHVMKYLGYF